MGTKSSQLTGTIQKASPNLKGFDTDTIITASQAEFFKNAGYAFCIRYLSREETQGANDLSNEEATIILNAGLALSAVQHVAGSGWSPSETLGTTYGTNAVLNATTVGLPAGMNIWCDLEGIASNTSAQNVIDYCNAWYNVVEQAGYIPGLYVGAECILTGEQLYENLKFQHYWKSLSTTPSIPTRGYQMVQSYESNLIDGLGIDIDTTQNDELGNAVLWLKAN